MENSVTVNTTQKMKFPLRISSVILNVRISSVILNGKVHFLWSVTFACQRPWYNKNTFVFKIDIPSLYTFQTCIIETKIPKNQNYKLQSTQIKSTNLNFKYTKIQEDRRIRVEVLDWGSSLLQHRTFVTRGERIV